MPPDLRDAIADELAAFPAGHTIANLGRRLGVTRLDEVAVILGDLQDRRLVRLAGGAMALDRASTHAFEAAARQSWWNVSRAKTAHDFDWINRNPTWLPIVRHCHFTLGRLSTPLSLIQRVCPA